MQTPNGIGAHIDAPNHFVEAADAISDIMVTKFISRDVVIDVSDKATAEYALSVADVVAFENQHGKIAAGSVVIANTGWSRYWNDPAAYRNTDEQGTLHFPRFSPQAADYLLERDIRGIGIDTLSPDGSDYSFPVHHKILGAGKYIIENPNIPSDLPVKGILIIALPL